MIDIGTPEDKALKALTQAIQGLVDGHFDYSGRAFNIFGHPHTTVVNGAVKPEGEASIPWTSLEAACDGTLAVARAMRATIDGPAVLFWRVAPELNREGKRSQLYTRFSFERWAG